MVGIERVASGMSTKVGNSAVVETVAVLLMEIETDNSWRTSLGVAAARAER